MKFLERLFGRKKDQIPPIETDDSKNNQIDLNDDSQPQKTTKTDESLIIDEQSPEIVGELSLCGKYYLLKEFELEFMQDVDKKNKPASEVYGGFIHLSLHCKPDDCITEWIVNKNKKHNGEIRFYINSTKELENSFINVNFAEAYCSQYKKEINILKNQNFTKITLCPKLIKIGNEEFELDRKE